MKRHDYGDYTPSVSGLWDTNANEPFDLDDLSSAWDPSVALTVPLAIKFVESVKGERDIVTTKQDVEYAHEAYGGMGRGAIVPCMKGKTLHYWVRGHTGMMGTNYNSRSFTFP